MSKRHSRILKASKSFSRPIYPIIRQVSPTRLQIVPQNGNLLKQFYFSILREKRECFEFNGQAGVFKYHYCDFEICEFEQRYAQLKNS